MFSNTSSNSLNCGLALLHRSWTGLLSDPGRVIDAIAEPLMFFVVWGLFFAAGMVPEETASTLLLVNLIWAATSALYKQAMQSVLFDFWSKEFIELFRLGIGINQYLLAMSLFGASIGLGVISIYFLLAPLIFAVPSELLITLLFALPVFSITALALAYLSLAIIFRFSQLYAFAGGVSLQLTIALSSPFVPRSQLPGIWKEISYALPLSWVFDAIHQGKLALIIPGGLIACLWLGVGVICCQRMFAHARRNGKISRL
jgi:hypothetical protein